MSVESRKMDPDMAQLYDISPEKAISGSVIYHIQSSKDLPQIFIALSQAYIECTDQNVEHRAVIRVVMRQRLRAE